MEIEAKYTISTLEIFQRLNQMDELASLSLSTGQVRHVHDTYLDTTDRKILAAGYACRRRQQESGETITLKGLRKTEGAIHRREEHEISATGDEPISAWPESPVRDRLLELVGDAPLVPLFALRQTRTVRPLMKKGRQVADVYLDDVRLVDNGRKQSYFELEVELTPEGTEDELVTVASCLSNEWGLQPVSLSKFERALIFIGELAPPDDRLLTERERATCLRLTERDDLHGRRAKALLALDQGMQQEEAGQQSGMSTRRVRYWLAEFRAKQLGIFPQRVLDSVQETTGDDEIAPIPTTETVAEAAVAAQQGEAPQPWPMKLLLERYEVDRTHARAVAGHAVVLFDRLQSIHNLAPKHKALVEMAAIVHNIGIATDPPRHHTVGRDILLAHPPVGLDDFGRRVLAVSTLLHRKKITSPRLQKVVETDLPDLPESAQSEALAIAALVRLADGLDYSQGSSRLGSFEQDSRGLSIEVGGPFSSVDANRAQSKSDLWKHLFGGQLFFKAVQTVSTTLRESIEISSDVVTPDEPGDEPAPKKATIGRKAADGPGLTLDDSMAEAAAKTLRFHFRRMLEHEEGTRQGTDIEELHDMRVATRRMRAAFEVFGGYLDMDRLKPFAKGLRRTGRSLGAVRDLDVFQEKTQYYLDTLGSERKDDLKPLMDVWRIQRKVAREQMLVYLDSDRYVQFKQQFGDLLEKPQIPAAAVLFPDSSPRPHRLRQVVPIAVFQRLAEVRAYDEWMNRPDVPMERYHQLRISSKALRYTFEYFREVLGPEAKTLIGDVKALQDNLGDLNDAVVACNLLRDFLTWGTWGYAPEQRAEPVTLIVAPGVTAYLTSRQIELQQLIKRFPVLWQKIRSPQLSRLAAEAIARF